MSALAVETNETFHRDNLGLPSRHLTYVSPNTAKWKPSSEVCEPYVAPEAKSARKRAECQLFHLSGVRGRDSKRPSSF